MSRYTIEDFDQDKFTAEIRAFAKKNGISTRRFPEVLGIPYTSFIRIEDKEHGLTISTAQKLLKAMRDFNATAASPQAKSPAFPSSTRGSR